MASYKRKEEDFAEINEDIDREVKKELKRIEDKKNDNKQLPRKKL